MEKTVKVRKLRFRERNIKMNFYCHNQGLHELVLSRIMPEIFLQRHGAMRHEIILGKY